MALDSLSGYSAIIDNASAETQAEKAKENINSAAAEVKSAGSTDSSSSDSTASSDKLMSACKQFESYLWEQVYKEMKKTTSTYGDDSSNDYGSNMVNLFMDDAIETVSQESVTDGPNSLAQTLYDQLKRNYNIED